MKETVLITGATRGLGYCLANKFEEEGHSIFRHMGKTHYDLKDLNSISKLASEAKEFGVSLLINNAGLLCPGIKFSDYSKKQISEMLDINLKAPILLTSMLLDNLNGLININSIIGLEFKPYRTIYSATKWGLRGFSNSLRMEKNDINVLDVYTSRFQDPDNSKCMDINKVVNSIYDSYINKENELIMDGRPSSFRNLKSS